MAGLTNGLILCLLSVIAAPSIFTVHVQNSHSQPRPLLATVPQSPVHIFPFKNSSVFLSCGITTTGEVLDTWWLKNGIKIQKSDRFNFTNSDLTIYNLEDESELNFSDNGVYRCVVSLQAGVLLGPNIIVSIVSLEVGTCTTSTYEGILSQNVVLNCCIKSIPPGNVSWDKVNSGELNSRFKQLASGSLFIENLAKSDSGSYRCVVQNDYFSEAKEAVVHLSVQEHDEEFDPQILDTFENEIFLTPNSTNLLCAANGNPRPTTTWLIPIESNNLVHTRIVSSNIISLTLGNATAGNYSCIAFNGVKQIAQTVLVKNLPSFPNPATLIYPPAKTARFECRSPLSPTIWYKDGTILQTKGRVTHRGDELIISNTIKSDSGFYQCENTEYYMGTGRLLIEEPRERVDAPVSLNCTSPTSTQILVNWRSSSGRNIQASTVHYTPVDRGTERQAVTNETTILLSSLAPNTNYSVYVRVYTGKSASDQSQHVYCTTAEDTPTASPTFIRVNQLGPPTLHRLQWKRLTKSVARGAIAVYKLQWRVSDGNFSNVKFLHGDSLEFIISGLLPATSYTVRLLPATSAGYPVGNLPWTSFETGSSNYSNSAYKPPELIIGAVNTSVVMVSWEFEFNPLSAENLHMCCGFRLFLGEFEDDIGEIIYKPIIYLGPEEREFKFTGLNLATLYQINLQAYTETWESNLATKTARTDGDISNATNFATIDDLSAVPISSTEIRLNWPRPFTTESGNYVIRFKAVDSKDISYITSANESIIVNNLKAFTSYEFDVAVQVEGKYGPFSQKVEAMTSQGLPSPPVSIQFQVVNRSSIQVTWNPPVYPRGVIRGYRIELTNGKGSLQSTKETKLTLYNLQQNKVYPIRIAAETIAGYGEFSEVIYPKIFNTVNNTTSKTGENGEVMPDWAETTNSTSGSSWESSQQQLGLIFGLVLGLICIVVCVLIIIWRNSCFSFVVSSRRRTPNSTLVNGVVEKDTVDGTEMTTLRSRRNSESYLDTKGGHPNQTVILTGGVTDPLLTRIITNPGHRTEEQDSTYEPEELDRLKD